MVKTAMVRRETISGSGRRSAMRLVLLLAGLIAATCLWTAPAQAWEGINVFKMVPSGTQAGGHPDVSIVMEWDDSAHHNGVFQSGENPCQCDDARVVVNEFPRGFIGNPHAIPTCEVVEFAFGRCPAGSQVGEYRVFGANIYSPMYNVKPHPDEAALIAMWVPLVDAPVFISLSARTESDYGLNAEGSPIYHLLPIPALRLNIWGVPADPVHDPYRFKPPLKGFAACVEEQACEFNGASANVPVMPYIEAPTECNVPLTAGMALEYYTRTVYRKETAWPSTTGCEQLTFNPSLTAEPTTSQADAPSGVDIDLRVPQEQNPTTPSPSEIRSVTTQLPAGFSIDSNVADGKTSCSDAESAIGTRHGATCPPFSKVGSLTLDSAALPTPIPGSIYLGEPKPGDPYRLILAADGYGTHVKLAGSVKADPVDGRLTVSFPDLPQSPLTEFDMHFFGAERGLLATPTRCGSYPVESRFVPWDQLLPDQTSVSEFNLTSGPGGAPCPGGSRPFAPELRAGTSNPTAGLHSPMGLELKRRDGDQNLDSISLQAPPGFSATLAGVPYCPEAVLAEIAADSASGITELAAPKCPTTSRIGTALVGAGAGSRPVHLPGRVYLTGPYKGSPLSLAVVTPAVSGPYDLGNVVVRAAIAVDPTTAQVSVISDQLPKIVEGIPLRLRSLRINLNKPEFTLNPTNCSRFSMATTIGGDEGASVSLSPGFQVANCASLPYAPKLGLTLTGGVKRRGHPAIHALLTAAPGEANTKSVAVTLPNGEQLDNSHLENVCTKPQFAQGSCPDGSRIGTAEVKTPLLADPLAGNVYLRSSGSGLPDLVADLEGQFDIELVGRVDTAGNGGLRATFDSLPDAPVSSFRMDLLGGSKGLLVNSASLCRAGKRAVVKMGGQNGVQRAMRTKLKTSCGASGRKKRQAVNGKARR